ncbi:MAG: hypothetical protein WC152_05625 [Candidatus Izemoplasmatales bacterium]
MFKNIENYKLDIDNSFKENYKLYNNSLNKKVGNISFRVLPPSDVSFYQELNLCNYNFDIDNDIKKYTNDLINLLDKSYSERSEIDDNMIPAVFPILGIGDYSAFVAGNIIFQPETSWGEHVLKNIDDWKNLPPLGTSPWYKKFLNISEELIKKSYKQGIPYMRGFFSPLDLAHALRGEDIYYDFYDEPIKLHELLNFCADATIKFAEDIYALVEKYYKNTKYGMWYTKNQINMSEDIACMISGDTYREFCRPHTQRVINHFGTGYMHCHSRAMYLVKEICDLDNVVHLWLATDPNQTRPIDNIEQLVKDSNSVVVAIDCERFEEIEENYEKMKNGNFSICLPVSSVEEGIEMVNRFNKLVSSK